MAKNEEGSASPSWGASFFMQTSEDVAMAFAAAASAINPPRPSVVFSSKDEGSGSPLERLQRQVSKAVKNFYETPKTKSVMYNPEVLTSQKRQWAKYQDQKPLKDPSRLFESVVVVGLHPNCDIQALERQYISRKSEGSSGRLRSALVSQNHSRVEPSLEPQVLLVYPPDKQPPIKYKDLHSFCFPGGIEVNAVERTPSMSELSEIILSQEHLRPSDLSFVFRLQVADNSTLYGCCILVEEIVNKPSRLLSTVLDKQPACSSLSRYVLTTRRCYCILTRLPFFELHFGVLNSIFLEERLEHLMSGISFASLEPPTDFSNGESLNDSSSQQSDSGDTEEQTGEAGSELPEADEIPDNGTCEANQKVDLNLSPLERNVEKISGLSVSNEVETVAKESNNFVAEDDDSLLIVEQGGETCLPDPGPLLRCPYLDEIPDSNSSFQAAPCERRRSRKNADDNKTSEASVSGQDDTSGNLDILEWAKSKKNGSLQILCEYYQSKCPARGSTITFHPLEHLHLVEYHRPDEMALHTPGSAIDQRSCSTSLDFAEAHTALMAEEEAAALSTWAVASLCGSLRLDNVLMILTGALLEKQIVFVCSNLGILAASVLSIIPVIRPFRWQSLLMPVLPDDMLEFLDAPVPYIVGVKNKTSEVQSKLTNVIVVDVTKNQVKSPSMPQLPQYRDLYNELSPYHSKLVGESYLAKKRPVYECTDVQVDAAKGFLGVLRSYLDSLCSNLQSHTITNVQSNNDKVSLLLKESFIDSFPSRQRAFMKLFVDTQLFSVHTDLVLSFIQKL
ncbi:DENN domain and WD repeat-containing protein SCD1 [Cardamine amara subsp. amara]|uniref:DENN domain and WD repeat-containing protein SCD1 n=1 Tax=Cardamine amara subsp. amara TaxID=228776 RepID=A0ABD1BRI6_CARAN